MRTISNILLLSLLALAVTSCARGYHMYQGGLGPFGYTHVYERTFYPAVYVAAPYRASYSGSYVGGGTFGGAMGGGMH